MKTQLSLLPARGILACGDVMTKANTPDKHGDEKWKRMTSTEHVDAALRHLYAWLGGEQRDPELETSHLANAATRLLMSVEQELMAKYHITDTHPKGYVHLMESPLPAPANPEWEAYVDGTLSKGNASEDNPEQEIAKVGDWIRITSGPVIGREALVISDALDDVRNRWLTIKYPGGRWTIRDKNYSIIPSPQKGIDDIKPSEWDAANTSFLAAQEANQTYPNEHQMRYTNALDSQRKGDEE